MTIDMSSFFLLLFFYLYAYHCRYFTATPGITPPGSTCSGTTGLMQWNYVPQNAICGTPVGANTLSYTSSCSAFTTSTSNQFLQTSLFSVRYAIVDVTNVISLFIVILFNWSQKIMFTCSHPLAQVPHCWPIVP